MCRRLSTAGSGEPMQSTFVRLTFILAALVVLLPGTVEAEDQVKLAVMTLEDRSGDLSPQLVDDLTDYLRTQIARRGRFVVIDKSRQADALKKVVGQARKESYKACYDANCQIPLGRSLSADTILRVRLTRIGSTYQLNAEMVDLAKEAVDPGAAGLVEIPANPTKGREDRLLQAMRRIAAQIAGDLPGGGGETINLGGNGGDFGLTTSGGAGPAEGDGIVKFESDPPGAIVEVDGRRLPRVTPVEEFLQLGRHTVRVFGHEGFETLKQEVDLHAGQVVRISLRPVTGSVVIRPRDAEGNLLTGVAVFIDGEEVAKAPVRIQGVRAGKRQLLLTKEGMRPAERLLHLSRDERIDVDVQMVASEGVLRVDNIRLRDGGHVQSGLSAQVLVDDEAVGNTPIEIPLVPGDHTVTVKHRMGRPQSYPVSVQDGQVAALAPELVALDTPEWRTFVNERRKSQRTGTFLWLSFLSSAPGRYQRLELDADGRATELHTFARYGQALTYGIGFEGDYLSLRAWDSIIDIGGFDLPGGDGNEMGISPFTNPGAVLVFRPTPMFPLKVEGLAEFYWATSSEDAETQISFFSWTAGGHLLWEVWQDYLMGHPLLEVGAGVLWYGASGDLDPEDWESATTEFEGEGMLYGGKVSFAIPTADKTGFFLGAGYYMGEDGEYMILWQADWRGAL